jgi:Leucine-rich repeat (LRR) protein
LKLIKKIKESVRRLFYKEPDPSSEEGFIEYLKVKAKKLEINGVDVDISILGRHNVNYLTKVDLSYCGLDYIPKRVFDLRYLKDLNLKGNMLTTIPDDLMKLDKLEYLDISFNRINKVPPFLCYMESLYNLLTLENSWIEGNPLITPPIEVAEQGISEIAKFYHSSGEL